MEAGSFAKGRVETFTHTFKRGAISEAFVEPEAPECILVGGHFDITFAAKEGADFEFVDQV